MRSLRWRWLYLVIEGLATKINIGNKRVLEEIQRGIQVLRRVRMGRRGGEVRRSSEHSPKESWDTAMIFQKKTYKNHPTFDKKTRIIPLITKMTIDHHPTNQNNNHPINHKNK